jgi:HPr kinase/phosphorylase
VNNQEIHATAVALSGTNGVLLLGASGCGKSDVALRLLDRDAALIADDRVVLTAVDGLLFAAAPESGRGLLEVRGVGVVRLPPERCARYVQIKMAVKLDEAPERMPENEVMTWLGVDVPLYRMQAFEVSTVSKLRLIMQTLLSESGVERVT